MKQIIILCFISFASVAIKAQSSGLQFNQALFLPVTIGAYSSASVGTVPSGKVWKLEQVATGYNTNGVGGYFFLFNNGSTEFPIPAGSSYSPYNLEAGAVYWWPAGTQIAIYYNNNTSSIVYVNILEFNVVQ